MKSKQLSYALSIAAPVVTALVLVVLAIFTGDLIGAFLQSNVTDAVIAELKASPSNGTWAIAGAIAGSVVSIILLAGYEVVKNYYLVSKTDASVINSIIDELDLCQEYIDACTKHLEYEITTINKKPQATLLSPPTRIEIDIWALLKSHIPIAIAKEDNLLSGLRILSSQISSINYQLDGREQYHIHCKVNSDFYKQMEIYDKGFLSMLPNIQALVKGLSTEVKKLK